MAHMKGKRIVVSVYLDPGQKTALDKLTNVTRVPTAAYVREAIDDLLTKYKRHLKGKAK